MANDPQSPERHLRVLRIPADVRRPCEVLTLPDAAVALSDALGGGLLDDPIHDEIGGRSYCWYLDEERVAKGLPRNERAAILSARLGGDCRDGHVSLSGDVLVVGITGGSDDDVPVGVLVAAWRGGLLPGRRACPACGGRLPVDPAGRPRRRESAEPLRPEERRPRWSARHPTGR